MFVKNDMLPKEEYLDVTLLCIMEIMGNVLADRAKPKSYRANRIALFQKELERIAPTYQGRLPEEFGAAAEHLYKTIETGINWLLVNHAGEETKYVISEIDGESAVHDSGCGEGEGGQQGCRNESPSCDAGSKEAGAGSQE